MEFLKILIVDDEMPVRQELASFPWEKYECHWTGEAKNGKEALQLCVELKPDIVISDIAMPIMGGLDLATELKKLSPNIQVIILSGHENFEYVKTALRLNVLDYIVKFEMNEESIAAVIKRARQKLIESGILQQSVNKHMRRELVKYFVKLRDEGTIEESKTHEVESILYSLDILPSNENGCIFLIIIIPDEYRVAINDELCEYLEGYQDVESWLIIISGIYVIKLIKSIENDYKNKLVRLCNDIINYLSPLLEIPCLFIVHYKRVNTVERFIACLKEFPVWYGTYFYNSTVGIYEEDRLLEMAVMNEKIENELEQIFSLLSKEDNSFINEFINYTNKCHVDIDDLKRFSVKWLDTYFRKNHKSYREYLAIDIHETLNIKDLADCIQQSCMFETKYRAEIKKAINIINEEYPKRLNLSDVSDRVGLSPQYFSRIFHEETEKTFSDYLIMIRIEHAQELLKEGHFKVYEIAELVGIPNYRYFSTLFRKIAGYTPKQIRKGNSDDQ